MLYYLNQPTATLTRYQRLIDTATGIVYNFYRAEGYLTIWSIHNSSGDITKMDGPSVPAFWAQLLARACHVDPPPPNHAPPAPTP